MCLQSKIICPRLSTSGRFQGFDAQSDLSSTQVYVALEEHNPGIRIGSDELLLPCPVRIPSPWHSGRAIVATIVVTGAAAKSGLQGCQNLITWGYNMFPIPIKKRNHDKSLPFFWPHDQE